MPRKLHIPSPFFIKIPRWNLELIIENIDSILVEVKKLENLVENSGYTVNEAKRT